MASEDYVLSFDFEEVNRQIADIQASYTSLSSSFNEVSEGANKSVDLLVNKIDSISTNLTSTIQKLDQFYVGLNSKLGATTKQLGELQEYSKGLHENLSKISKMDLSNLEGLGEKSPEDRKAAVVGFSMMPGQDDNADNLAMSKAALETAEAAKKESKEAQDSVKSLSDSITETVKREMDNAKSKLGGIASGFSGGALAGGGLMALLGMVILGQQEKQRKGAERGEMLNAFEMMGSAHEKGVTKATNWFARFAEHAQYHFGIGRKEIQDVIHVMGSAGFDDLLTEKYNKPVTDARANIVTTSIALDKLLNQATGTSMKRSIEIAQEYNMSLSDASNQYTKLALSARNANMSFDKFIETTMAGKSSVSQFGIELTSVGNALVTLQRHYKTLGVSDQMAGDIASRRVQGAMSLIGSMNDALLAEMGMDILPALTGKQPKDYAESKMEMKDLEMTATPEVREKVMRAVLGWIKRRITTAGSEGERIMQIEGIMGATFEQAKGLLDLIKEPWADDLNAPISSTDAKALENAFKTEGKKLTELQKIQRDLIDALAKTGEGLLKVLTSILGILTAGVLALPILAQAGIKALTSPSEAMKDISAFGVYLKSQTDTFISGMEDTWEGLKDVGKATGSALETVVGPMDNLKELVNKLGWSQFGEDAKLALNVAKRALTEVESLKELYSDFNNEVSTKMELIGEFLNLYEAGTASKNEKLRDLQNQNRHEIADENRNRKKKYKEKDLGNGRTYVPDKASQNVSTRVTGAIPVWDTEKQLSIINNLSAANP